MIIKRVEVRIGLTKNLGNYESLRLDEGVTVDVEDGEKPSVVINQARTFLEEKINKDAEELGKRQIEKNRR